jgi:hypothetical protein
LIIPYTGFELKLGSVTADNAEILTPVRTSMSAGELLRRENVVKLDFCPDVFEPSKIHSNLIMLQGDRKSKSDSTNASDITKGKKAKQSIPKCLVVLRNPR